MVLKRIYFVGSTNSEGLDSVSLGKRKNGENVGNFATLLLKSWWEGFLPKWRRSLYEGAEGHCAYFATQVCVCGETDWKVWLKEEQSMMERRKWNSKRRMLDCMDEVWQLNPKPVYVNMKGFNFENENWKENLHYVSQTQRSCKAN